MSLRSATAELPHDRASQAVLRDLLGMFRRRRSEWVTEGEAVRSALLPDCPKNAVRVMLDVLRRHRVLEFEDGPPRYRYADDALTELEVVRYIRVADSRSGHVQTNLERFRKRFGTR